MMFVSLAALLIGAAGVAAQPPTSLPAYPDLRYIIHYGDATPEFLDFLKASQTNFLHWHGPFFGYTGLPERDRLPQVMASAKAVVNEVHQRGALIIFYIGPCFSYGDADKQTILFDFWQKKWDTYQDYLGPRPADLIDCVQRDAAGKPRPYEYGGQTGYHLCVNSPGVRQYAKGCIRLICEAGADGSFYDGPYVTQGSCYCHWCRDKFRAWLKDTYSPAELRGRLGVSDPATVEPPTDAHSPLWAPWRKFGAWSLWDFMRDTKEFARHLNPKYVMTANYCMWMGEPYGPLSGTAEDIALWSKVIDVVFDEAEYGAGPRTENGRKRSNSIDYRYLVAASHGKPVALLKTAPKGETPEAEGNLTRLAIAEGAAGGAVWQFHQLKGAAEQAGIEYNRFLAGHAAELRGARPHANVGLVASVQQAYYGAASYPCAVSRELADRHIDHRMLIDEDVEAGRFEGLDALILPEVRVLTERQLEAVKTFARNGGGVVAIGPCGDLDEWGRARSRPLAEQLLRAPNAAGAATKGAYGQGRVACLPHVDLPSWANLGLTPEQREGLAKLAESVEYAAGDLSLRVTAPPSVEATAMYGPGNPPRSVFVHLVNYDVDLAGKVTPPPEIGLRVQLPDGMDVGAVRAESPDAGVDMELGGDLLRPGWHHYALVRVPRMSIYSRVKLWLVPAKGPLTGESLRLLAPESVPSGETLTVPVEYRGTARVIISANNEFAGLDAVGVRGADGRLSARLFLGNCAAPGELLRVEADACGRDSWQAWDARYIRVTAELTLAVTAPPRVGRNAGPVSVTAEVTNHTARPRQATVTFGTPDGWRVTSPPPEITVPAGGTQTVRALVEPEAGAALGTCFPTARLSWSGGPRNAPSELFSQARTELVDQALTARCARTKEPPIIDGRLDDACWRDAPPIGSFVDIRSQKPSRWPTTVKLLYDDSNLYAAFECSETEPQTILAQVTDDGGEVWRDDSVELFCDPKATGETFQHFVANVPGVRNPKAPAWQVKTSRTATGWSAEVAVPFSALARPAAGDVWLFDACRTRPSRPQAPPEYSSWAPTEGTFHQPGKWGYLVFGP